MNENDIYATQAEAEVESNRLYLLGDPNGTTEMLYGWVQLPDGRYHLRVPEQEPA